MSGVFVVFEGGDGVGKSTQAALLTEYRGIGVGEMSTLRRSLRDAGGEYKVYKNTLVRFAAMDRSLVRSIASKGGRAAHASGSAHEFTSEEAREAGRKGGKAPHRNRGPRKPDAPPVVPV